MRVLIIEDEFIIAQSIQSSLQKNGHEVCTIASTYSEALHILDNERPEIAIIDLKLKGSKSGIDLAEKVNQSYTLPFIFLTSSTDENLLNSLKYLNPSGIIVKPFNAYELNATLSLALFQHNRQNKIQSNNYIFIKLKTEYSKINLNDITYIKSKDVYIIINLTDNQQLKIRSTLDQFQIKLNKNFIRVHRSFIVNTNVIDKVFKEHLLISEAIIPIGNKYKVTTLDSLNIK